MEKVSILYFGGNKPGPCPKVWIEQLVQILHSKAEGATDRSYNVMLLRRMEEEWTPIDLNTFSSKIISVCLEDRVEENQVQLGTFATIKDKVLWQLKKTVIHWGIFTVGRKIEQKVISPDVMLASGYVRRHILNKERFNLLYCPEELLM